jgi:hypothetical protein
VGEMCVECSDNLREVNELKGEEYKSNRTKTSSVVVITTTPRAGRSGFRIPFGQDISFILQNVQTGSGAHPASYSVGYRVSFPGVKRTGLEVNQ